MHLIALAFSFWQNPSMNQLIDLSDFSTTDSDVLCCYPAREMCL